MSNLEQNPEFEALLTYIKRTRGFDFTGYKRASLMRRVQKRMQALNLERFNDYLEHLEAHPQEFVTLFNTILINVTSFFRDRSVWEYLSSEIIPRIVAGKEAYEPIRIWSAGCAAGQEAYTLAIALVEALGLEQFKEQVKIYATDLDDESLQQARQATYTAKEVLEVPPEFLSDYFERSNANYTFSKDLRRSMIFGRHNLVQDAPISRIDLLVCRNTLMYFNAEAQARIIARFHFALNEGGYLFLGKAEMLLSHSNSFLPVDLKRRIFTKVVKENMRSRLLLMGNNGDDEEANYLARHVRLRDAAFDANPLAQVVIDINGLLILANEPARTLFGLAPRDLNRPWQDLEFSYRPVELRSCIDQVYSDRQTVNLKDVEWTPTNSETQYFDVQIVPLFDLNSNLLGATITFSDVSHSKRLQHELEQSNQELEMAYEELQSTNEELETMNEELQSSNEELHTLNEELRCRTEELNSVNTFLESILGSMRGGVMVLDRDLRILVWNNKTEDLWGLRADEVRNKYFLNLDIGLPVEQLIQPLRNCLLASSLEFHEMMLLAINRRGKTIKCKVTCTPLIDNRQATQGAILIMEEQEIEEDLA